MMKKRAIISVSDKTGVLELAEQLVALGFEIVSTGGTYKAITEKGIPATYVTEVTGFPEILDGRVKTLHPFVHAGILAMRTPEHLVQLKEHNITPVDLVVVNLYPFKVTIAKPNVELADAIENIDIGGPTMVRAAAKNYKAVAVVVNPARYPQIVDMLKKDGKINEATRLELATEAFTHTAEYDAYISNYLKRVCGWKEDFPETALIVGEKLQSMRYGENPHQKAAFYRSLNAQISSVATAKQLQGKELSYNNIVDIDAALELVKEFNNDGPAVVIIKHTNPCGVSLGQDLQEAYGRALAADPISAYGGIVGLNGTVDAAVAKDMSQLFLEAIVAPGFLPEALEILSKKINLRLLATGAFAENEHKLMMKNVNGGFLLQDADSGHVEAADLKVVTKKQPTPAEIEELLFAWRVVKHVKSNAIVLSKDKQVVGVGAGHTNRVGAANVAFTQAGSLSHGAVLASEAFFPFRDTVDQAVAKGIKAIIQPGGSIRDEESIQACDEAGIAMVFTGMRHFKH